VQLHLLYVVDFTSFEKHSWFLLQPAQQATHDNRLCFVKIVSASKNRHTPVNPKLLAWPRSFCQTNHRKGPSYSVVQYKFSLDYAFTRHRKNFTPIFDLVKYFITKRIHGAVKNWVKRYVTTLINGAALTKSTVMPQHIRMVQC